LLLCLVILPIEAAGFFQEDFEQRFFGLPEGLITDHTLILDPDDVFHLFYTVGVAGQGWPEPGNMIDFGHATSPDLIHWTDHPRILSIDPTGWKNRNLWAPHVVKTPEGTYLLVYTGVDSSITQATGSAFSFDLYNWHDLSREEPAYHPDPAWASWELGRWSNGRDPFIFRLGSSYGLLSTATANPLFTGAGERGAVSLAFSHDGVEFEDAGFPLFVNDSIRTLESTSIYRRPDRYFLFFVESGMPGLRYMQSPHLLYGWDKTATRALDPIGFGPSEVVSSGNATLMGRVHDADYSGTVIYGVKIDTLLWATDQVTFGVPNTLQDRWIANGNAFEFQPVFGDRAAVRGGPPSGHEGFFWINTAETYTGPIHHNDPEAPPEVERTGVLRSQPFVVEGDHMSFRVAGGADAQRLYVALVDEQTNAVLRRSTGTRSNVMQQRVWDLEGLQGVTCRIDIVDLVAHGPHGYIAVDAIQEGMGMPPVGVADQGAPGRTVFLGAAYPSPTTGPAVIPFSVEREGRVELLIYDLAGRLRARLLDRHVPSGAHEVRWNGTDRSGHPVAAGTYFLRLETEAGSASRQVTIVR
jgi:hypothetical protein